MKKLSFIFLLFFLVSCESKRVLFVSEFNNVIYKEKLFSEIIKQYKPTIEMDEILKGTSKNCYGVDIENPVYFCQKGEKISVISFYKIIDSNKPFELNYFYQVKRNKYEEESLRLHENLVKDISIKFAVKVKNQLISKQKMKNTLEMYKDNSIGSER